MKCIVVLKRREELQTEACECPQILAHRSNNLKVNSHKGCEQENSQNSNKYSAAKYSGLVHLSPLIITCSQIDWIN